MALQRPIEKVNAQSCRTTNEMCKVGWGRNLVVFPPDNSIGGALMTEKLNTQLCINYFTDFHGEEVRGRRENPQYLYCNAPIGGAIPKGYV